jgi:hypothetical protein
VGGVVYLLEGTYNLSAAVTIAKSNVTLRGSGGSTIFVRGYNEAGANGLVRIGDSTNAYENIRVENLTINGNEGTWTSANNRGISINGHTSNLIDGVYVSDVMVKNASGNGFVTMGAIRNATYTRCYSTGTNVGFNSAVNSTGSILTYDRCISSADVTGMVATGPRARVLNCHVEGTTGTAGFPSGSGIVFNGATDGEISGNIVLNTSENGIQCSAGTDSVGIKVIGNVVKGAHAFGMIFDTLSDATVQGNTVSGTATFGGVNGYGIYINTATTRITLSNNNLLDNAAYGLAIVSGATTTILASNFLNGNGTPGISDASSTTKYLMQDLGSTAMHVSSSILPHTAGANPLGDSTHSWSEVWTEDAFVNEALSMTHLDAPGSSTITASDAAAPSAAFGSLGGSIHMQNDGGGSVTGGTAYVLNKTSPETWLKIGMTGQHGNEFRLEDDTKSDPVGRFKWLTDSTGDFITLYGKTGSGDPGTYAERFTVPRVNDETKPFVMKSDGGLEVRGPAGNVLFQTPHTSGQFAVFGANGVQFGGITISTGTGVPAGACSDGSLYLRSGAPNGSMYICANSGWWLH